MSKMELLADALEYLETHLEEDVRTEDVARECYCSKSTLEKLFQCVNHISVHEYLVKKRMTKAARLLLSQPELGILQIAVQFGYSTNESFTRAFKQVWNCNPSEFRATARFTELFPRLRVPYENGDEYVKKRRQVDISELYDLFLQRKGCYFICCDIKNMIAINDVSYKAGDIAILNSLQRMNDASGEEDVVFRIGGDEFALLTNSNDITYAETVADKIRSRNGEPVLYEDKKLPLNLHVGITKLTEGTVRYNELFSGLHKTIQQSK